MFHCVILILDYEMTKCTNVDAYTCYLFGLMFADHDKVHLRKKGNSVGVEGVKNTTFHHAFRDYLCVVKDSSLL